MDESRTFNTLFMLISLDGKISTGSIDERDVDKDYKRIKGIKEGLKQYYELERQTDRYSFNTGRVMAKIGVNSENNPIHAIDVNFIIMDNNHLTEQGVRNLANNLNKLILVTKNPSHPAHSVELGNLEIISYDNEIDFADLFIRLKKQGAERVTIQSGGTINSILIRNKLIDRISVVIAPALVGGKDTASLVDGESITTLEEINHIKALKLVKAEVLEDSYLHVIYDVINETVVE